MNRKDPNPSDDLRRHLQQLKLPFTLEHFEELASRAAAESW